METITVERLSKKTFNALEKVFAAEIEGRLFQSKAKIYEELEEEGLVCRTTMTMKADKSCPFPLEIKGWSLTATGHFLYCMNCPEVEEE